MIKIIGWACVGLIGINLFLFFSGIAIPWLISTNQVPLAGIFFIITTIIALIVTIICCIINKKLGIKND